MYTNKTYFLYGWMYLQKVNDDSDNYLIIGIQETGNQKMKSIKKVLRL